MRIRQGLANRLQVVAGIETRRDVTDVLAERLAVAQESGARQGVDLGAGIVDVVLACYGVTGERKQVRERVTEGCPAAVTHVQGPGWVHRNVLDIDRFAEAEICSPVTRSRLQDGGNDALPEGWPEAQVQKARPRHLDSLDVGIGRQLVRQKL